MGGEKYGNLPHTVTSFNIAFDVVDNVFFLSIYFQNVVVSFVNMICIKFYYHVQENQLLEKYKKNLVIVVLLRSFSAVLLSTL